MTVSEISGQFFHATPTNQYPIIVGVLVSARARVCVRERQEDKKIVCLGFKHRPNQ